MENPEINRFGSVYRPPKDWNCTPDGPIALSEVIPSRDIVPIVKNLYGEEDEELKTYQLPHRWTTDNPEVYRFFFHEGFAVNEAYASDLGGV